MDAKTFWIYIHPVVPLCLSDIAFFNAIYLLVKAEFTTKLWLLICSKQSKHIKWEHSMKKII